MTISNVERKCANCVNWGISFYTPFEHCMLHEGNYTGDDCCDDFNIIKFKDIIPAPKDVIHRYLDRLKEEGLIDHYEISTVYMDDKAHCTSIKMYRGKYSFSRIFNDLNDKNRVIETLANYCIVNLYQGMANYLMEKIKEDE